MVDTKKDCLQDRLPWDRFTDQEKETVFQFVKEHKCNIGDGSRQLNQMLYSMAQNRGLTKGICIVCGNKASACLCYKCKNKLLQTQFDTKCAATWERFSEEEKRQVIKLVLNGKDIPFSERKKALDEIAAKHSGVPGMCVVCGKYLRSKDCVAMCKTCQSELKAKYKASTQVGIATWDALSDEERDQVSEFLKTHDCHNTDNRREIGRILWKMVDNHSGKKRSCMVCGDTILPSNLIPMCKRCENEKIMSVCKKATEHPVWEKLSQKEKDRILKYADGRLTAKTVQSELGDELRRLIKKYNGRLDACIHCGGGISERFKIPMCKSCRWKLGLEAKKTRAGISLSELDYCADKPVTDPAEYLRLKTNIEPKNLYWAYPSEELFREVLPLFTPGKPMTREEMVRILDVFEKDRIREYQATKTNRRYCTICGKASGARSGLCPACRKFIAQNGCPIAMPKGSAVGRKLVSLRSIQMFGDFERSLADNKRLPLIKVR